jgi:membrane-associated phospholipid phosphatase
LPAFASADELTSSITVTQQVREKKEKPNLSTVEFNRVYFNGYVTDFKNIVTAPARWDLAHWIGAGIVTGIAAGLYDNDAKIQQWVLNHKTTTTDNLGYNVTSVGLTYTPVILGGMYLYGYVADDSKMRETVLLTVESVVLTGVFVQALKYSTQRHRPYTGDGPYSWDGIGFHGSNSKFSFPSGHASTEFAIAAVIASEYDNYIVPPLAYSIATITALYRISHNDHWSTDVFVGSAIGYLAGKTLVTSHLNVKVVDLTLAPMINDGGTGIVLTYRF